jgi:hypothetical protein
MVVKVMLATNEADMGKELVLAEVIVSVDTLSKLFHSAKTESALAVVVFVRKARKLEVLPCASSSWSNPRLRSQKLVSYVFGLLLLVCPG